MGGSNRECKKRKKFFKLEPSGYVAFASKFKVLEFRLSGGKLRDALRWKQKVGPVRKSYSVRGQFFRIAYFKKSPFWWLFKASTLVVLLPDSTQTIKH